jgi:hypothetical protein
MADEKETPAERRAKRIARLTASEERPGEPIMPSDPRPPVQEDPVEGEPLDDDSDGTDEPEPEAAAPSILTEADFEDIRKQAEVLVAEEMEAINQQHKKAAVESALEAELLAQRQEAGLTDHRDDMLQILVDCPPFSLQLVIDGKIYEHGRWYTVSRRLHDTMREMMARGWDAEERAGNPNHKFRPYRVAGSMNPMMRENVDSQGNYTLGLDSRVNAKSGTVAGTPTGWH